MKIENIHDWGLTITLERPQEFFDQPIDYWRSLIYTKPIIFFKTVNFTNEQYAEFSYKFGKPWSASEYKYSHEGTESAGSMIVSPFSNESKKLGMTDMPWHADIPNRRYRPFPFRSLWIVSNPNPCKSGKTRWMNLEKAIDYLTPEMVNLLPRVRIVQQSWYDPGTDVQEFDLIKTHPITGRKSLRLNYYNWLWRKDAWITGVKIDGVLQPTCKLVKEWLEYLERIPELLYEHTWDTNDIAIYDNWTFLHARTKLLFNTSTDTRKFYRINIDHISDQEWEKTKNENVNNPR